MLTWNFILNFSNLVCALEVDHKSSVLCNTIADLSLNEEMKKAKDRYQYRPYIHQWICLRDVIDGLITYNYVLKNRTMHEILNKIDIWLKSKTSVNKSEITDIKLFKIKARQLVWDLMELK